MKTMNNYIARNSFNEDIVDLVNDYLENSDVYPEDTCIAIQKCTNVLELIIPSEAGLDWKTYPIASFIRQNDDKNELEVDIDATLDLADNYFFTK